MDAAALSLKVDSSDVVKAANDLDRFSASATKAAAASGKIKADSSTGSIAKLVASVQALDSKLSSIGSSIDKIAQAQSNAARAAQALASANDNAAKSTGVADAHVIAYTQHLAALVAAGKAAGAGQSTAASAASSASKAFATADSHVTAYRSHLEALAAQARATAAATAGATGPNPTASPAASASTADLQRYAAAAKAIGPANEIASSSTLTLTTSQSKLSLTVRTATADIRAQVDALRDLNGSGPSGAGGSAAGATASLGALESAANAAAAALRAIDAAGGGGGGAPDRPDRPDPSNRASGSPYYGAANLEATGQAAQIAAHHAQNLFYQLNDVFVSLISGQKPMTVFIQQGSQIGQIYTQTGLSLKGFMLGLAAMLRLITTTTAATEAAALAQAQQSTVSIAAANAQAVANVRAAETNIAIAQSQIAMATTATEAAAAEARLAVATAALGPAQAEAAITARALATAQAQQASAASAAQAATRVSLTAIGTAAIVVTGVIAGIAAAFALGAREINKHNKDIVDSLDLTDKQLKKVKKSGVDTAVTMGDTFKAFFEVAGERLAAMFKGPLKTANSLWDSFLNYTLKGGEIWVKAIVGGFVGAIAGIKAGWALLPAAIGDVAIRAVNKVIDAVAFMINKGGDLINGLLDATGSLLPRVTFKATATHMANEFAGAGQDFAQAAQKGFIAGRDATNAAIDRFFTDVGKRALKNRKKMILDAAGDPEKTPKGPKSDAEKLADIYRRAEGEIAAERARGEAVGMSARAAAELEQRTKLLNQIEQAKIPITAAVTKEVNRLAAAYADEKITTDAKKALQGITDGMIEQRAAIADQTAMIGLYGDALTRARIVHEQLNKARAALPRGETLSTEAAAGITADANLTADKQIGLDRGTRAARLAKDASDAAVAMDLERAGLSLTKEAALQYAYVVEKLNEERRAGNEITPQDLAGINAIGAAYARQRYQLDQHIQRLADAREVTKGFWQDWINGARQGQNVFESFANSALNALNRIIDKLLDRTFDSFFDSLLGGKGGGLQRASLQTIAANPSIFAKGGAFGTPQRFANGGAFTNTIVNTPTLFQFAKGGKLGEMGEAGPEAIMPLKRGPNGALGVQMHGGGRPIIQMGDVHLHNSFAGAVGMDSIAAMNQQAAAAAVTQIRRDFASIAAEYEQNGVVAA